MPNTFICIVITRYFCTGSFTWWENRLYASLASISREACEPQKTGSEPPMGLESRWLGEINPPPKQKLSKKLEEALRPASQVHRLASA